MGAEKSAPLAAADWLARMHGIKGRFLPGYLPALKQELEGDNLMRQASARILNLHQNLALGD